MADIAPTPVGLEDSLPLFPVLENSQLDTGLLDLIIKALRTIRLPRVGVDESEIHAAIESALMAFGIRAPHEVSIGPRCRVDFLVGGIVIEAKKRRPVPADLVRQVTRYAESPACLAVVVVAERAVRLPERALGKPVHQVSLNSLWGIAV